jgi:magnesium transporter
MPTQNVRTRAWRNGTLAGERFPLTELAGYLAQPDCLVWADICGPDEDELYALAAELTLDRHAVEDALGESERPKATRYRTHLFVAAYAVTAGVDGTGLSTSRVSAFALRNCLLTVRLDNTLDMDAVAQRWEDNSDLLACGPRALLHGLLDAVVDGYFEAIEALDDELEQVEDALFDDRPSTGRQLQLQTFALRKSLVHARRVILPMREVVNTVMRRPAGDDQNTVLTPYYEDLYDHTLRAAEWVESLRDMITSIFETNLTLADARMNLIMKKLTSWAAIIAVPTAITGYFGQNVPYPGVGASWGFWLSVVSMLLIAAALYAVFRRKDWL